MGRVYAVASGKGGVGKTTTTAALGATLAAAGARVAVVDADLGMANLGPSLGVDGEGPTLHDVLAGTATVAAATREGPDSLAVVPGARDIGAFADARPEGLATVLGTLAEEHEHVLVDTGAGLNTDSLAPLRAADEVVLVSTPARDALADTERTAAVSARFETPVRGLVLVRAGGDAVERARERIDREVLGAVPDDPATSEAVEAGVALPQYAPESPAVAAYRDLARTLTGVDVPEPSGASDAAGDGEAATDAGEEEAPDTDAAVTVDDDADAADATDTSGGATVDESGGDTTDTADTSGGATVDESGGETVEDESEGVISPAVAVEDGEDTVEDEGDGDDGEDTVEDGKDTDGDDGGRKGFFSRLFG